MRKDDPFRAVLRRRAALLLLLIVQLGALGVVFDREWRDDEVFSPADLLFQFYPWAHDAPRAPATNPTRSDEAFYHQPLMETHFARVRAGDLPDFDPGRLSGVPAFFQGLDTGRLASPFSLPFYLMPAIDAVSVYGPLRLLVAALCMWMLLRGIGLSAEASALGGVAYGLNGHFLTWLSAPLPTVAAWLPLGVLAVHRVVHAPAPWGWTAALAAAVGLMAVGSYPATFLACLVALGVQALVEAVWHRRLTALLWLTGGVLAGLCLGAVALVPTLANLLTSPASARVADPAGAGWANLATWALPDFWGSPLHGNWWHPDPNANYPEHVAYFGITVTVLAGAGVVAAARQRLALGWVAILLAVLSGTRAYGVPPGRWLIVLPGQVQSNPFRWYAVTACALALLAALGLHALRTWREVPAAHAGPADARASRTGWLVAGGAAAALALLAGVTAAALLAHLPEIRARGLQPFEMAQVWRFVVIGTGTAALVGVMALAGRRRWAADVAAVALVVLAAGDLAQANRRFNPTVPRDRYYPATRGIAWLAEHAAGARVAPVDAHAELVEGHVWSLFGIHTVTGFDYHGDAAYQAFLEAAQGAPPPAAAAWDYVGLKSPTLDLRLLGVLAARYIVTSPVDVTPRRGGYADAGPLVPGRRLTFTFRAQYDGLRRVDVLVATYGRTNEGVLTMRLVNESGVALAERRVPSADLRDNDWLAMTFPPAFPSAGRLFTIELSAEGTTSRTAPTVWLTAGPSDVDGTLAIDGERVDRTLWFRAFSSAPERVPGAELAYAGDLNVYRNPHARPPAWFVDHVIPAPLERHLSTMGTSAFDPETTAVVVATPTVRAGRRARVTSIEIADDVRRIGVEADEGGVLLVSERAHAGWTATIDGRPATWQPANAVIMAVDVPAGAREVVLAYEQPLLRPAIGISLIGCAGIVLASLLHNRRRRR
jgi:hypothetical protein